MRRQQHNVLDEDEIRALANKWWGNGIIPEHYFEALKEAARLGAERAAGNGDARETHEELTS